MIYTETIQIEDGVTPVAQRAQRSLSDLTSGLGSLNKTLVNTEGLASRAAKPLTKPMPVPSSPSMTPALAAMPAGPALAPAPGSAPRAAGGGLAAVAAPALDVDASPLTRATAAAAGLSGQLAGVARVGHPDLAPTGAGGLVAASKSADGLHDSMAALPTGAETARKGLSQAFADAAHVAEIGAQTIGAALSGIKASFSSLAAGDVRGAIAGATEAIAGMAQMLDMVVPGLGQIVSTVIKIGGGIAGVAAGLVQSAMSFALAANEAQQQTDGMFEALGQGAISGAEVGEMIDGLQARLGIAAETMEPFAASFLTLGITGRESLERLTTAAVSMEALVRGGGAAFSDLYSKVHALGEAGEAVKMPFRELQAQLAKAGLNAGDLAKEMGVATEDLVRDLNAGTVSAQKFGDAMTSAATKKGAGPLATLANSAGNLGKLLNDHLGKLFEDLGETIGPFMGEVRSLFGIFDQANPSGQAMKDAIGGGLSFIFGKAAELVPMIKHAFLDLEILALKGYIALKPYRPILTTISEQVSAFGDAIGKAMDLAWPYIVKVKDFFADLFTQIANSQPIRDGLITALKVVGAVIGIVIGLVVGVVVAVGAFMASCVAMTAIVFGLVGSLLNLASTLGSSISGAIDGAIQSLSAWISGAAQLGSDFVAGLVAGISSGAKAITDTVTGLADSAVGAFKGALGIASPSRVMMELGAYTGEGLQLGMESYVPDVHGAASELATAATTGASSAPTATQTTIAMQQAPAAAPRDGGGSSGGLSIEHLELTINGAGKDWSEVTEEMAASLFERIAMQLGRA